MNSGDEIGKAYYRIGVELKDFDEGIDYITKRLDKGLPKFPEIKVDMNSGDVVEQFQVAENQINSAKDAILSLTHALGDLSVDASATGESITRMLLEFSDQTGQLDGLIDKLNMVGQAAGIDSNGQLFNGLYELRDKAEGLVQELATLTEGTTEYQAKNAELTQTVNELQDALRALDSSYRPTRASLQGYIQSTKEAQQATEEFSEIEERVAYATPNMARQLGTILASWNTLRRAISTVTESLQEYREIQDVAAKNSGGEYLSPLAESWNQLDDAISNVKLTLGSAFEPLADVVSAIAEFINQNREAVAAFAAFATGVLGVAGAVGVVTATLKVFGATIAWTKAQLFGFIGIVGAIVGVVAGMVTYNNASTSSFDEQAIALKDTDAQARKYADDMVKTQRATSGAAKATKDYSAQLAKLRRDFLESLKQIEVTHDESIANIREDLEQLRTDYENTISERNAKFELTTAEEEKKHQELVDELRGQLNFLQRYNNEYNKEKLARVQFTLEKAEYLYQQETQKRKEELDLQNQHDKEAYEKRAAALQQELDDEVSFMERHREDLNQVRNVILLDEIDMLKRRYEEQQQAYADQEEAARVSGAAVSQTWQDYYNEFVDNVKSTTETLNTQIKNQTSKGIAGVINDWNNAIQKMQDSFASFLQGGSWTGAMLQSIYNGVTGRGDLNDIVWKEWGNKVNGRGDGYGYAFGGYTGSGSKYEVAGIVHRGEYVIPQEDVDQETGTPKVGTTQNITINVDGVFATSSQERRRVAEQIADALAQLNKAGRLTAWQ